MSDVLDRFVRPFDHLVDGEDDYRRLLTLGVLAWNAALQPEREQQEMVDDVLRKALREESEGVQAASKQLVGQLIERKRRYFAEYRRPILDFKLTDLGDHYHLAVISALV